MESIEHPDSHFRPTPASSPGSSAAPPGYLTPTTQQPHLPATAAPVGPGDGYDPRLTWKTAMLGLVFAIGSVFILGIFYAIALAAGASDDSHAFNFIANAAQDAFLIVAALLAVRGVVDHITPQVLGFRGLKWSGVGWAAVALVLFLVISAVYAELIHVDQENVKDSGLGGPLLVIFAVGIAPIVEETFFRGFLFRSFRNGLGVIGAALVTGLLFGSVHIGSAPVEALPLLALLGVMLALLFEQTRSLWPCILLHMTYNTVVMLSILLT